MGLLSWLKRRGGDAGDSAPKPVAPAGSTGPSTGADAAASSIWEPLPAYLPVNPSDHTAAVVIASAIAAGDRSSSELKVKRVLMANPEHRRVTAIATALAAGALEQSSFTVKNIYKMKEEGSHAA